MLSEYQALIPPLLRGLLHKECSQKKFRIILAKNTAKITSDNCCTIDLDLHKHSVKDTVSLCKDIHGAIKKHKTKTQSIPDYLIFPQIGTYKIVPTSSEDIDDCNGVRGSVVFIAGAAQGIGAEIAKHLIKRDAYVYIADINSTQATSYAKELCKEFGRDCASAVKIDVTNEQSVMKAVHTVLAVSGGIDVLLCNVGIVKPGAVETYELSDFVAMMKVNYVSYFLLVKHFVSMLRLQNSAHGKYFTDIIQINSKSGIEGSAKNSAYTGSKFGGIGLTRSFAHELIPDNIKVNAICPGNYYDGNLWSDPQKGLFVQFLNTGRVPNAKTPADVRKYYEEKTPLKRGVLIPDIVRAVVYAIEQNFETGQAIPVAGGQIMLH